MPDRPLGLCRVPPGRRCRHAARPPAPVSATAGQASTGSRIRTDGRSAASPTPTMPYCKYRRAIWYETIYSNTRKATHKKLEYTFDAFLHPSDQCLLRQPRWGDRGCHGSPARFTASVACRGDRRAGLPLGPCASAIRFRSVPSALTTTWHRPRTRLTYSSARSLALKARPELSNVRLGDWRAQGASGELRPTERLKIAPARAYHGPGMGEQDAQYRPR